MFTVELLKKLCEQEIALGNGEKQILISDDDEGNGYHTLFYGFTSNQDEIKGLYELGIFHDDNDPNNVIILG